MFVKQPSKHRLRCSQGNDPKMISLIAAVARNHVIGIQGKLPWHLPKDFAWFKACTKGKAIIMGRKTFESLGRPLPHRLNIIISRKPQDNDDTEHVIWATSLSRAIQIAKAHTVEHADKWDKEIMIIGGGEIYAQAMPIADRLYLTEVDYTPENGDAFFPPFAENDWKRTVLEMHAAERLTEKGTEIIRPFFEIVQYDRK